MAGANGPTSAGGTVDTPNPEGGATEKPAGTGTEDAKRKKAREQAPQDRNGDG